MLNPATMFFVLLAGQVAQPAPLELQGAWRKLGEISLPVRPVQTPVPIGPWPESAPSQILFHMKLIEVPAVRLASLEKPLSQLAPGAGAGKARAALLLEPGQPASGFVERLKEGGRVRVLAEPTLVTLSGRPASLHVGGQVPAPGSDGAKPDFRDVGTKVELLPTLRRGGALHLKLQASHTEVLPEPPADKADRPPSAALKRQEIEVACEIQAGQTLVVAGRSEGEQVTLVVVSAEIVEATPSPSALLRPATAGSMQVR